MRQLRILVSFLIIFSALINLTMAHAGEPFMRYIVSMPQPESHSYHLELQAGGWNQDTLHFKMPRWMPGYYQIMDYAKSVENVSAKDDHGTEIQIKKENDNTWVIAGIRNKSFDINYDIKTSRQFVANSYCDSLHAYLIPENSFFYADGFLRLPVSVKIDSYSKWKNITTGLDPVPGKADEFTAPDFDVLYDCPILLGNLEELPAFRVNGVEHRFIGYQIGDFDRANFTDKLRKTVVAAVAIIGDIPYKNYTFIGIGPGRGGIEHLNNTTVSFDGKGLNTPEGINKMMNFLAHEYFHHFNVKRIRPFELGPFDYDHENRTNLLWVSEGLSVYYEYLIVKHAGLMDEQTLLANLAGNINSLENNPGRAYQSLSQASYSTWKDGPFGTGGDGPGKSISYYDKGPVLGLFLDFAIRHATQNKKSLDDVMRLLYWKYYKSLQRGFTDAEFQQACETVAGTPLTRVFEYVYTTKELDYSTFLGYGGLIMNRQESKTDGQNKILKCTISRIENPDSLQTAVLKSWLGGKF